MPGSISGADFSARSVIRWIASAGATSMISECCPAKGGYPLARVGEER